MARKIRLQVFWVKVFNAFNIVLKLFQFKIHLGDKLFFVFLDNNRSKYLGEFFHTLSQ